MDFVSLWIPPLESQNCNGTVFESTGNDVTQKYMYSICRRKRIFPKKITFKSYNTENTENWLSAYKTQEIRQTDRTFRPPHFLPLWIAIATHIRLGYCTSVHRMGRERGVQTFNTSWWGIAHFTQTRLNQMVGKVHHYSTAPAQNQSGFTLVFWRGTSRG